ncbi:MAG: bifunctional adenosylcobinamide kinase/adenosylcobinamide-phosphate guanylyltransferase [Lachnospiraceae bacterium]|nr:bifunctional adenosylcobinamide kinase/adenosylcobinamide-phosphate guanylyltransferase [Lachnospiraceae bacterium]
MIVLVIGGSGSGKSEWAEKRTIELSGNDRKLYFATMQNDGEEAVSRIARHREMRKDKGFQTVEVPFGLKAQLKSVGDSDTILLEDLSNLAANLRFWKNMTEEEVNRKITEEISAAAKCSGNLVIVSNDIFRDGTEYDAETARYISLLGRLNIELVGLANEVVEIVAGIPVFYKKS